MTGWWQYVSPDRKDPAMAWRSRSREDIEEHRAARRDLDETSRRDRQAGRQETEESNRANQRVADAEKNVSWWRR